MVCMAGKRQLPPVRLVAEGETAPVSTVVGAQTRLDELRAMRRVMAAHIDNENTLARDLAALVRQLRDVSKEIEELETAEAEAEAVTADSESADAPFRIEAI